jgi:NAD(P)H dehydrogenase (quinone)
MNVLTVYAHPNPKSFCHAVLQEFTRGLAEAGHTSKVVDLHAIRFDPVFGMRDFAGYVHESIPTPILEGMELGKRIMGTAKGPVERLVASRLIKGKNAVELARLVRSQMPKDVVRQQELVAWADGLAFIAPIIWLAFPAILKGWFERVFNYGFAYALTPHGWEGNVSGRVPLLRHRKALVITPTIFSEDDYRSGLEEPIRRIVDDWGLRYPGVKHVEHVYFYKAAVADKATLRGYLDRAYNLGREYGDGMAPAEADSQKVSSRQPLR